MNVCVGMVVLYDKQEGVDVVGQWASNEELLLVLVLCSPHNYQPTILSWELSGQPNILIRIGMESGWLSYITQVWYRFTVQSHVQKRSNCSMT